MASKGKLWNSHCGRLNKKRCRAVQEPNVSMKGEKRLREEIIALGGSIRELKGQVSALENRLESVHISSSPSTHCEDPSDYGQRLRASLPAADHSIVPKPLSSERADLILPSFENCLSMPAEPRIRESDFRRWMDCTKRDPCNFLVQFSGNTSRAGRKTKNVDFSLVRKGKSASLDVHIGALLSLLSHGGRRYNGSKELGEAVQRANCLLNSWRSKVIVGLTNGICVEWFSVKFEHGTLSLQVSPEYPLRESLCALLVTDPSNLHVSFLDIPGLEVGTQIGEGRTSLVFSANYFGQNVAAKVYKKEYGFLFEREAKILQQLKDVPGIPRVVKEDTDGKYLLMTPVGRSLASLNLKGWQQGLIQLVVTLQSVHEKGIIHRDIRPANILLVEDTKDVLLIDWGFACAVREERTFAGSVETGSNRLLRQLLCKYGSWHCSKNPSITMPLRPSKQGRSGHVKDTFKSPATGGDVASKSEGVQTRSKSRLNETETSCCLGPATGGTDVASKSGGVQARSKAALSETETEISCCMGPEDDLVSLIKTILLINSTGAKEKVKEIASNDYQNYLEAWRIIMEARPLWKEAQDHAEKCDYEYVTKFLKDYVLNFMV